MHNTIVPELVSLDYSGKPLKGSYLFNELDFFPKTRKRLPFHYSVEFGDIDIPPAYSFRHGFYTMHEGIWYYERAVGPVKFQMRYDPATKTFRFSPSYQKLPVDVGSLLPTGKHVADIMTVDLMLAGYTIVRGCAYKQQDEVVTSIRPSYNGKTTMLVEQLEQGARYIAEDILVIDFAKARLYPTAAGPHNFGRNINPRLYDLARSNAITSDQPLPTLSLRMPLTAIDSGMSATDAFVSYMILNAYLFMDSRFARAYLFMNKANDRFHAAVPANTKVKIILDYGEKEVGTSVNQQHWNELGSQYGNVWKSPAKQVMSQRELGFVTSAIAKPDARILDIGCGTGRIIGHMAQAFPEASIYGVDIAASMIEDCQKRFADTPQIKKLQVCDVSAEPIPFTGTFDAITSIRVVKYNRNWQEMIAKAAERLAPGGVLVFSMPNANSINRLGRYHIDFQRTTVKELRQLAAKLGLTLDKIQTFTRVPDALYDASSNAAYNKVLLAGENAMKIFGKHKLGRELFITMKK